MNTYNTYICVDCKLSWSTNIQICVNCREKLEVITGNELQVIGITEILAASTTHPKVPYFVVLVKDEHDNLRPIKTEKQYSIGDKFVH